MPPPSHTVVISSIIFLVFLFGSYYDEGVKNSVSETSLFREKIAKLSLTETKEKLPSLAGR